MKKETASPVLQIDPIPAETLLVPIRGTAPLLVHRFGEKARRQMLDAMQGKKKVKSVRNPEEDYENAFYRLKDGRYGFPVMGFKHATVGAARFYGDLTMTGLRQFIFFRGEMGATGESLAAVEGEPRMREDYVRIGRQQTDLRYRPEFPEWSTTLSVTFVASAITRSSVLSLIDAGGMAVGIGEWRPEKNGDFGTYQIDPSREVEVLR